MDLVRKKHARMNYLDYRATASFIIGMFKTVFINSDGLISRINPPSNRTIFDNFDDIAPFFLFFDEEKFLIDQIKLLKNKSFEEILSENNLIYSYKIDEYLGGLYAVWKKTGDQTAKDILDDGIDKVREYFIFENDLFGVYDIYKRKTVRHTYFWSAGILETFLEMLDDYQYLSHTVKSICDHWIEISDSKCYTLFPFRYTENRFLGLVNKISAGVGFYRGHQPQSYKPNSSFNNSLLRFKMFLFYVSSGQFSQLMKANSTFIFTIMKLFQITNDLKYKATVDFWIVSVANKMIKNNVVFGILLSNGTIKNTDLTHTFIFADILIDFCAFIEENQSYIDLTRIILMKRLKTMWQIGLLPMEIGGTIAHIDSNLDFSITLRRYGDLTGEKKWKSISLQLIHSILTHYRSDNGFYSLVNIHGDFVAAGKVNAVDPKYNGLLLKGIINAITLEDNMYENLYLHDLFKDR
jgi:hypothetical protein